MRARIAYLSIVITLAALSAAGQQAPNAPKPTDIYCSGIVTKAPIPYDTYLISGEQSDPKITFARGDLVYINKGSSQGVKVGDEYLVTRAVHERLNYPWFTWQTSLMRAMGTRYADLGRLRVVHVQPKVAVAQVVYSCDFMLRGDVVRPFAERPVPVMKTDVNFDRFAPASGRKEAMVVTTKNFGQIAGTNSIVYVNLGSDQGVKVGDYFRVFRYQGIRKETAYQTYGMAYKMYGFGRAPTSYKWSDLPREVLGEGIVLRVGPNASTVLLTLSLREIYVGDYVELE